MAEGVRTRVKKHPPGRETVQMRCDFSWDLKNEHNLILGPQLSFVSVNSFILQCSKQILRNEAILGALVGSCSRCGASALGTCLLQVVPMHLSGAPRLHFSRSSDASLCQGHCLSSQANGPIIRGNENKTRDSRHFVGL